MASERKWFAVSQAFIANGTANGIIQVSDAAGFYVKAQVRITSITQPDLLLEVKRIDGTQFIHVGPIGQSIDARTNVSAYLVADSASITLNEQKIPTIKTEDIIQAVYDREPIVAIRSVLVDRYGKHYSTANPLPVRLSDGSINIGTVNAELEVQLSHKDNYPNPGDIHDSIRLGDGVNETTITPTNISKFALDVMPLNRLIRSSYDQITITSKNIDGDPTQIEFRSLGALVATVNITYDADGDLQSVTVI